MTKAQREKQHHREVAVSRAKLVLIIVCLIAIPVTFWINHHDVGSIRSRITRVESPCQRYGPDSRICERAFEEAATSINHRMACFFQHRAGVFPPSCQGVHLRIAQNPGSPARGGGASQQPPPTAHQLPSPQHGGSGHEGKSNSPPAPAKGDEEGGEGEAPAKPPAAEVEAQPASSASATTTETSTEEERPPSNSAASEGPPGLIGNPGGAVGKLACGLGEVATVVAGTRICSE